MEQWLAQALAQGSDGAEGGGAPRHALEVLLLHGPEEEAGGARPEEQRQPQHTCPGVQAAGAVAYHILFKWGFDCSLYF